MGKNEIIPKKDISYARRNWEMKENKNKQRIQLLKCTLKV